MDAFEYKYYLDVKVQGETKKLYGMEPRYTMEELKNRHWKMVICYRTKKGEHHSIFTDDYAKKEETFSCVNSWGPGNEERPSVSKQDVYGIFYVSIVDSDGKI